MNKPAVDVEATEKIIGNLTKTFEKLGKRISVKEMYQLKTKIDRAGGVSRIIDAYLNKEITRLSEAFKEFQKVWNELSARMARELKEYEEIAKAISG